MKGKALKKQKKSISKINSYKKKTKTFSKNTTISEIIRKDPSASKKLMLSGLGCACCPFSQFETLQEGAEAHGIDVEELLKNLND